MHWWLFIDLPAALYIKDRRYIHKINDIYFAIVGVRTIKLFVKTRWDSRTLLELLGYPMIQCHDL